MAGIPGGSTAVDLKKAANRIDIEAVARFALEDHNKKANSHLALLRVVSASKQVVAGSLTKLKLLAADSAASSAAEYEVAVWEKAWMNFKEVTEFKAAPDSSRPLTEKEVEALKLGNTVEEEPQPSVPALAQAVRPSDPAVQQAAEKAVALLQQRSNSLYPYQLQAVSSASVQRDADDSSGTLFFLTLELTRGPSNAVEAKDVKIKMSGEGEWTSV